MHRQCKVGQVTWEAFSNEVQLCRGEVRKAKAIEPGKGCKN